MALGQGLSWAYVVRNLKVRKTTTVLTATGIALVVFVFACVLMMVEGLNQTMGGTGSYTNVVVIRKGSQTEVQSTLTREQVAYLKTLQGVGSASTGEPQVSAESVVLVNLPRRDGSGVANVVIRGTGPLGLGMRPQVQILDGRLFQSGQAEVVIGEALTRGKLGLRIGDEIHMAQRPWRVVGVFSAGKAGFESEVWADGEQLMQSFKRMAYSSALVALRESEDYAPLVQQIQQQPRLMLEAKRESIFYRDQSEKLSAFIGILGKGITFIFSLGAVIGAMITMYSSVANRTREIGSLRALGFQRNNILMVFLKEAAALGFFAGLLGLLAASGMQWVEISTTNVQTFSEIVFRLVLTPTIAFQVLLFSVGMGVIGGVVPAYRASRLEIVDALRAL